MQQHLGQLEQSTERQEEQEPDKSMTVSMTKSQKGSRNTNCAKRKEHAVYVDRTHDLQIDFPKFDFSLTLSQLS